MYAFMNVIVYFILTLIRRTVRILLRHWFAMFRKDAKQMFTYRGSIKMKILTTGMKASDDQLPEGDTHNCTSDTKSP